MKLSLAVAAKGNCQPLPFLKALDTDGMVAAPDVEVHITHDAPWPVAREPLAANIHLHYCPGVGSIHKLWGLAIAHGASDYVAVLDVHCPPAPGWFWRVSVEMERGCLLFYGSVNPGHPSNDRRIVGYITEYAQFRTPLDSGLDEVPGNNVVFHRPLLDRPEWLIREGFVKTFLIWRLRNEDKLSANRFDDMSVSYQKPFSLGRYLKRRFLHGRCFAACRFDTADQPPRWVCLGFTPLLPALRLWRIYVAVRPHRDLLTAALRFAHLVTLSELAWSAGEFVGYLSGNRKPCEHLD